MLREKEGAETSRRTSASSSSNAAITPSTAAWIRVQPRPAQCRQHCRAQDAACASQSGACRGARAEQGGTSSEARLALTHDASDTCVLRCHCFVSVTSRSTLVYVKAMPDTLRCLHAMSLLDITQHLTICMLCQRCSLTSEDSRRGREKHHLREDHKGKVPLGPPRACSPRQGW